MNYSIIYSDDVFFPEKRIYKSIFDLRIDFNKFIKENNVSMKRALSYNSDIKKIKHFGFGICNENINISFLISHENLFNDPLFVKFINYDYKVINIPKNIMKFITSNQVDRLYKLRYFL